MLRADALEDFFREDAPSDYARCPRCHKLSSDPYKCEYCGQFIADPPEMRAGKPGRYRAPRPAKFNEAAYQRGTRHADSADIGGAKVGGQKTELGGG
jgi:hypothetical protein